jgi:hypothetical protein
MRDKDNLVGWEGGDYLIQRMDPIILIWSVPIPLMNAGEAIKPLPAGLPVRRPGVVETGYGKAKVGKHE